MNRRTALKLIALGTGAVAFGVHSKDPVTGAARYTRKVVIPEYWNSALLENLYPNLTLREFGTGIVVHHPHRTVKVVRWPSP